MGRGFAKARFVLTLHSPIFHYINQLRIIHERTVIQVFLFGQDVCISWIVLHSFILVMERQDLFSSGNALSTVDTGIADFQKQRGAFRALPSFNLDAICSIPGSYFWVNEYCLILLSNENESTDSVEWIFASNFHTMAVRFVLADEPRYALHKWVQNEL